MRKFEDLSIDDQKRLLSALPQDRELRAVEGVAVDLAMIELHGSDRLRRLVKLRRSLRR